MPMRLRELPLQRGGVHVDWPCLLSRRVFGALWCFVASGKFSLRPQPHVAGEVSAVVLVFVGSFGSCDLVEAAFVKSCVIDA